jgi:hypothetical protein
MAEHRNDFASGDPAGWCDESYRQPPSWWYGNAGIKPCV